MDHPNTVTLGNSDTPTKKRPRENDEEVSNGEKYPKLDSPPTFREEEHKEEDEITIVIPEIRSETYVSKNRLSFGDFIWKNEFSQNKFRTNFSTFEKIENKKISYNLGLTNVFYGGSESSSLILTLQNGKGLSESELQVEMDQIVKYLISQDEIDNQMNVDDANDVNINNKTNKTTIQIESTSQESNESLNKIKESDLINSKKLNNDDLHLLNDNSSNQSCKNNYSDPTITINSQDTISKKSEENSNHSSISSVSNNNSQNNNKNEQQENPTVEKLISEKKIPNLNGNYYNEDPVIELDSVVPTYNIMISFNLINFGILNFTLKDVKESEIIIKEIRLPSKFFTRHLANENPKIVTEVLIKKNYKTNTGFTGIINEAMTCYMNSMLQTLNILGYFKKAVFQIPNDETKTDSVAFSLQRLFYDLMTEQKPISTNKLVHSFGWSHEEILVQHDVQEFNLLLSDVMENSMKGTKVEGTFKYLFEGKIQNYIECIDVDYKSHKTESFCDLQLTVKGCRNINESLEKYTEEEILDDGDKYQTDHFGKQKAKKGIKFLSFPNVLILQLKRFEYNSEGYMDKINDYFQFDEEINLNKFMQDSPSSSQDNNFSLHSVVVHRGGLESGHYYAFIKPKVDSDYYKFDDETVREVDSDEVFTYNYGGTLEIFKHRDRGFVAKMFSRPDANAYILVYIRNSKRNEILCDVNTNDIPENILNLIKHDKELERKREIMQFRLRNNIDVHILSKQDILAHENLGITQAEIDINKGENLKSQVATKFNLPKDLPLKEFVNFISNQTGIPAKYISLFNYSLVDCNKVIKRHKFIMKNITSEMIEEKLISDIPHLCNYNNFFLDDFYFYIDVKVDQMILDLNPHYNNLEYTDEDEYTCDDYNKSIIYIPKDNKYIFKKCTEDLNLEIPQSEASTTKLIIPKYLRIDDLAKNQFTLKIHDIIKIEYAYDTNLNNEMALSSKQFKENYQKYLDENYKKLFNTDANANEELEVNFYLEKNSAMFSNEKPQTNENEENKMEVDQNIQAIDLTEEEPETAYLIPIKLEDFHSLFKQNYETDAFIIVVNIKTKEKSLKKFIDETYNLLFSSVYIVPYFANANRVRIPFNTEISKYLFILNETDREIHNRLLMILKSNYPLLKKLLKEKVPVFYLNNDKHFLNDDQFIEDMTIDNFNISMKRTPNTKPAILNEMKKYPLLKYIGALRQAQDHFITFNLNYTLETNYETDVTFKQHKILFFDEDNNALAYNYVAVPEKIQSCKEILNYIYDPNLMKFYTSPNVKNFYFLIQHNQSTFVYDIFIDKDENLLKYDDKRDLSIEYRLQPFSQEEVDLFENPGSQKLFIAIVSREGKSACDPMILPVRSSSSVREVKNILLEKMNKINILREKYEEITFQKVKFYTYNLRDYRPVKGVLLINDRDEDNIFSFYKKTPANILIEFMIEEKVNDSLNGHSVTNGSFVENGNSLNFETKRK